MSPDQFKPLCDFLSQFCLVESGLGDFRVWSGDIVT